MHPAVLLIPVAALILGPRLWVGHVLRQHNRKEEDLPGNAAELARQWLDRNGLQAVRVEVTDIGDHYDPETKVVRLGREKHDRRTLTAVTTAAHEVAHALQDASAYPPFVWRTKLGKLALVTGQVGTAILLTVPAAAIITRSPVPPLAIGATAFAVLGTGMAAQLTALPTELDASFARALPMLQDGCIAGRQVEEARKILIACSLTYVASSLLSVLHIWPWLGRAPLSALPLVAAQATAFNGQDSAARQRPVLPAGKPIQGRAPSKAARRPGTTEKIVRGIGKPLIRGWFRLRRACEA